jgi:hypothetical protein
MRPLCSARLVWLLLVAPLLVRPVLAESKTYELTLNAGAHDRLCVPVCALLEESSAPANPAILERATSVKLIDENGKDLPAQLSKPGLLNQSKASGAKVLRELHFILPSLKQGQSLKLKATVSSAPVEAQGFAWQDTAGQYAELSCDGRPVLRYVYQSREAAKKEGDIYFKPYHHLYDPSGARLVTKGDRDGLYPHHRGLFYGFSKISYGDVKGVNTWAASGDQYESHEGFLAQKAGPVFGRHLVAIDWHGKEAKVFAKEQRELTVYRRPGGILVEFASRLSSTVGPVKLDGDPQHAGFHFRAAQDVVDHQKETCYLRPDGLGKPGETRNWDAKGRNPQTVDLPWNAMCFLVGGKRYTAVYLDRPANPKEARYSERPYGRFGSYFEYELGADQDLVIDYRVWLQEGEMTGEEANGLSKDFVEPVEVVIP